MSWEPKFVIICDKHGELFRTEFETNIENMKSDHHKYNPHCKIEVKNL